MKPLDWLPLVEKQLDAIALLPAGWDSNGAPSPDIHLVESARSLIKCLAQLGAVSKPHVNPTPSGGVQFEWEIDDRYFELEVVAEHAAAYFCRDGAARVAVECDFLFAEVLKKNT